MTTLALLLGMLWPGEAAVLEGDPSGSDLMLRLRPARDPEADFLATEPSVFNLAADIRSAVAVGPLDRYAQDSSLGARVIIGPLQAQKSPQLRALWPAVAAHLARAPEVVFADLGRLQPGHGAWPLASASTAVLVLARPSAEGLYHLRDRVANLAAELGQEHTARNPVAAVMIAPAGEHQKAVDDAQAMLDSSGSPIPVVGWMAEDPSAVAALRTGTITKGLRRSALFRSVTELSATLPTRWPQLGSISAQGGEPPTARQPPRRLDDQLPRTDASMAASGAPIRTGFGHGRDRGSRRAARREPPR